MRLAVVASLLLLIDVVPRPAGACSFAGNSPHELDPAFASDTTPPGEVTIDNLHVDRNADNSPGCMATCGDYAAIRFDPSATDDRASVDTIGYRIRVVRGTPPDAFDLEDTDIRTYGGPVYLRFAYGAPAFDIDLEISAVDLNGNVGPPTIVTVTDDPDSGGCTTGRGMVPAWAFVIGALALALRRSRR